MTLRVHLFPYRTQKLSSVAVSYTHLTAEELVKSKWSSSDNNIVTVDDGGRIDGLSEGLSLIHI